MKREFRVGQTIWRGYRYWVNLGDVSNHKYAGWNTSFIPYRITKITKSRIVCEHLADTIHGKEKELKDWKPLLLDRARMELFSKQHHARYHEYFYAERPERDPEHEHKNGRNLPKPPATILNLTAMPYTIDDVNRAYKRAARTVHPDGGGSHEAFIQLQQARDEALRMAI